MKSLTFFSNFLNHHQLPLCLALQRLLGPGFTFVATTPFNAGAVSAGYRDMNLEFDFCLPAYTDDANAQKAKALGAQSDVVLSGGVADSWYAPRLKANKLTFRVSERPLKPLYASLNNPLTLAALWWRNTTYKNRQLYLLSCGAHTPGDFARIGAYKGKGYKWGYFPPVPPVLRRPPREDGAPLRLLWAGRMISWKHPEMPLALAEALAKAGVDFELHYLGDGELLDALQAQSAQSGLDGKVYFDGSTSPEAVQSEMERSDIFLFTSDENEGWGAVLNEAMAAGCAVLASRLAGSSGYLVRPGINGLLFNGGQADFVEKGLALARDAESRPRLGAAAFETMHSQWNGDEAAKRLVALCTGLLGGQAPYYGEGPCSPA